MASLSSQLFAQALQRIPGGVNSPVRAFRGLGREPFFIERAEGARIWDVDGNEYIDYVGSWGPAILGHAPAVIIDAIRKTAARGVSFGIPNPLEVEMAELICSWVPSIEKVRMVNSGTEATMSCLRLARGFTGRDKIIKFEGCYHGHVDALLVQAGSGALTHGRPDSAGVPADFAALTISLPFNDIEAVRAAFRGNAKTIAAVILEAIPANAGLYFRLAQLRELERIDAWKILEATGAKFGEAVRATLLDLALPWTFHRIGSMFCLFFSREAVMDLASAKRSDTEKFARYFRGCLDRGVY